MLGSSVNSSEYLSLITASIVSPSGTPPACYPEWHSSLSGNEWSIFSTSLQARPMLGSSVNSSEYLSLITASIVSPSGTPPACYPEWHSSVSGNEWSIFSTSLQARPMLGSSVNSSEYLSLITASIVSPSGTPPARYSEWHISLSGNAWPIFSTSLQARPMLYVLLAMSSKIQCTIDSTVISKYS